MNNQNLKYETHPLHAVNQADSATGLRAVPIFHTTSFVREDSAHAARLFDPHESGNICTRIMNPNQEISPV
ncbi:MAG: PLP-dependent transferase [Lentimicrobium sp.]|nr:PLP-dependent transferase [Lentimicrobium sp.]